MRPPVTYPNCNGPLKMKDLRVAAGCSMFAWGWEAWMEIVRGLRNVSGRLFNAPDYREGTVRPSAESWRLASAGTGGVGAISILISLLDVYHVK